MGDQQQEDVGVEAARRQDRVKGDNTAKRRVKRWALSDMSYASETQNEDVLSRGWAAENETVNSAIHAVLSRGWAAENETVNSAIHASDTQNEDVLSKGRSSEHETVNKAMQASEPTATVKEHREDKNFDLLNAAYLYIKGNPNIPSPLGDAKIFKQKTPLGNTLLHIAATYGNDDGISLVAQKASELLTARNSNDDMALHVAARAGHKSSVKNLLAAHLRNVIESSDTESQQEALNEILTKNKRGNTFIHEALLSGHTDVVMNFLSFQEDSLLPAGVHHESFALAALLQTNNRKKSILYLAIEAGYKGVVEKALTILASPNIGTLIELIPHSPDVSPGNVFAGESPFLAASVKQDQEINLILQKIPEWFRLRDMEERTPLHYAASTGYLDGVQHLLKECASCANERDKYGYFPLHLASYGGHVEVVEELIKKQYCAHPREIVDNKGRNFLHLAVESGKLRVVRYTLKAARADKELEETINHQDADGNTPLHLATLRCHAKIVHALTWDKRVKLNLVNGKNQNALDVCKQGSVKNPSLRQRLTWIALKSADKPPADPLLCSFKVPSQSTKSAWEKEAPNMDQYKDRINTLIVVSTLIVTVTFAAGFTLPGGAKSSDPGQGMALMLHRMWFKLFIFCITISMYGAISVTIILIWAQLGDLTIAILSLKVAKYCLGVTLVTLSLAFLAGVHLVISDLSWLATTALVISVTFTIVFLILYILLWLPSTSRCPIVRFLSYYPFLMLAFLAEAKEEVPVAAEHEEREKKMDKKKKEEI